MVTLPLTEVKSRLSELIDRVEQGETIAITRHGHEVARIVASIKPKKPVDFAALDELHKTMTLQTVDAGTFIRQLRDTDRY